MNWQEYEEAVGKLYEKAEDLGQVYKNIKRPDKVTDRPRQVDVWVEFEKAGHTIKILIDAKFHKNKINVRHVESVHALAQAVGAHKAVLVASNGWTDAASEKATYFRMDLMLLTFDEALEILIPDMWEMCPHCENDCIVLDQYQMIGVNGLIFWWFSGKCRECNHAFVWCQDCGTKAYIEEKHVWKCYCGHDWRNYTEGIALKLSGSNDWITISKKGIARMKKLIDDPKQKNLPIS